jgi:hypothetical protein
MQTVHTIKATPYKERLTALHVICLHIFLHIAPKPLDIRQYACGLFRQYAEKSDCASVQQALCGVALNQFLQGSSEGRSPSDCAAGAVHF